MKKLPPLPKSNPPKIHRSNEYEILGPVAKFRTTGGAYVLVDVDKLGLIAPFRWHMHKKRNGKWSYAKAATPGRAQVSLHRLLMSPSPGCYVDHVNGDVTDNRVENLRICTPAQNNQNRGFRRGNDCKGISFTKGKRNPWGASIRIGSFQTKEAATAAYDRVAKLLFGDFARTNRCL